MQAAHKARQYSHRTVKAAQPEGAIAIQPRTSEHGSCSRPSPKRVPTMSGSEFLRALGTFPEFNRQGAEIAKTSQRSIAAPCTEERRGRVWVSFRVAVRVFYDLHYRPEEPQKLSSPLAILALGVVQRSEGSSMSGDASDESDEPLRPGTSRANYLWWLRYSDAVRA